MKAQFYVIPIAMTEEGIITSIEFCIPDLLLSISEGGSQIFEDQENLKEKYENMKVIKEIEINEDDLSVYQELEKILIEKNQKELEIFEKNEPFFQEVMKQVERMPRIHIPTTGEIDDLSGRSGLILES